MAAYDLNTDKMYGHVKTTKDRTTFLEFCRYLRTLYPPNVRIAIVLDNFSPHLSTKVDSRVGDWAEANNVELAYVPTNASWLNRIEAQFQALRYFTLDGTDHRSHEEQNSMIRRYIVWRNRNAHDQAPCVSWSSAQTLPDTALAPSDENRYWSSHLGVRSVTVSLTPQLIDGQPQRDPSDRQGDSGQAES